jgi:hypothetical protein
MEQPVVPEMVDARLVAGDKAITPPQMNSTSLTRLDEAVDRIELASNEFVCASAEDYEIGAKTVGNIRKLTTMYENVFAPMKRWWTERLNEARGEETQRTGRLDTAKKTFERKMLTWKSAEDKRKAELQRQQNELEKKRAEERRLQQAEELAARGKETGNAKLEQAALDILDRPLDIAPTRVATTVPTLSGTGVHTVKRKTVVARRAYARLAKLAADQNRLMTDAEWKEAAELKGEDLEDLIICVGATLLLERTDLLPSEPNATLIRAFLSKFASRCAHSNVFKGVDAAWVKREFANRGDTFALGGIEVVLKEGLG